jgi:hypothetical protein
MTTSVEARLRNLPWDKLSNDLWQEGYALTPPILDEDECESLISAYADEGLFRSHIVMARFGFGRGEYKYFKYPLPKVVSSVRTELYPRLADIANGWAEKIGGKTFPPQHASFLDVCHEAGQIRPTPLILKYEAGDFNCLHQDLYGDVAFPLQATFFLSRREIDYTGGEFVLVEQRPRMQSRPIAITAERGQAVVFPTRYRIVQGNKGFYRTNLKHGVSPLRSGRRFTLGIIFHDAK